MRESYAQVTDLGAEVLAVSTSSLDELRAVVDASQMPFPVLSDPDHKAIDDYGVLHEDEPEGRLIARPAIFLIDREGRIRFTHVGEHSRDRPALGAVLLALETMR